MTGFSRRVRSRFAMLALITFALALVAAPSGTLASSLTLLNYPGATSTEVNGINSNGSIVGSYRDNLERQHGFLWVNGKFTAIDVPPAWNATATVAYGVSGSSRIVGTYQDSGGSVHGFQLAGRTYTRTDFPGAGFTSVLGISSKGIVGYYAAGLGGLVHGFLYDGTSFTTIDVPGATFTLASGIDSTGRIVGYYADTSDEWHAFVLNGSSFITFDGPGSSFTVADGVASPGGIVGGYYDASGNLHGFFTPDGITVPTTIDANGCGTGTGTYTLPNGINTNGFIVGTCGDDTQTHGFVLKP